MTKRPFYAIAHHCNQVAQLQKAFDGGANAIECDIEWDGALWVRHPRVLKEPLPSGTPFDQYLPALCEVADEPGERFALLIFDIKPTMQRDHVTELWSRVHGELAVARNLNVLFTVPELERAQVFDGMAAALGERESLGVDEEDEPERVSSYFAGANIARGCYGNGIDSGLPHLGDSLEESIRRAVAIRDGAGSFTFVYRWTINTQEAMRRYLDLKVDGLVTDDLHDLEKVLAESPYRESFELARRRDNPFTR